MQQSALEKPNLNESLISSLLDLDDVDRIILKHLVEYPALTSAKLARMMGVRENFIRHRKKKPAFQLALQKIYSTTDELLVIAAKKAAIRLLDLITDPDPKIALGAIKIALTRALNKPDLSDEDLITGYETNIELDGSLIQNVITKENYQKIIDV